MADSIREALREFDLTVIEGVEFRRRLKFADEEGRLFELLQAAGCRLPQSSGTFQPTQRIRLLTWHLRKLGERLTQRWSSR